MDATSQAEIDSVWNVFSAVPEAELNQMLQDPDESRVIRVLNALFPMKKIDLAELRRAAGVVR